jgi:hypothetical protein
MRRNFELGAASLARLLGRGCGHIHAGEWEDKVALPAKAAHNKDIYIPSPKLGNSSFSLRWAGLCNPRVPV